ncbi:hypothetical protein MGAD_59100 [Mycolicibacterium gadium]|uniref:ABC transporter domain-containing protein n=1 Tax=Mycolicibacterium gadium TaxID=1794 RepID=A0A7I7WXK8_MYCGU|nr:hypothetical protein MGAD_59100 [Mycolicibacterium gadium]
MLASLVSRLHDVTEGAIRIDGTDIREMSLPTLRKTVATAFEDPTLFSMSVAENLRLGAPDATNEEMARRSTSQPHSSFTTCRSVWTPASASRA